MSSATVSRWARRSVAAGVGFLVAWQAVVVLAGPTTAALVLGVLGFLLHVVFGKAYALVPSYFDRTLAVPLAPAVQLPFSVAGAALLALAAARDVPAVVGLAGAVAWGVGVLVFAGTLLWTVRDNLAGGETGTGEASADREPLDRLANAFMLLPLAYLLAGSYELLAGRTGLPAVVGGGTAGVAHLLAAGTGALLLFAVGFRLLPRFLVASPPRGLPGVVLPAGALGPLLVAGWFGGHVPLAAGTALEATAVLGFAAATVALYRRSDRRRVALYGPLLGVAAGSLAVLLGVQFAVAGLDATLGVAHRRLNLLGFLGLTVVGLLFQFYPPSVGTFPGATDRTALGAMALLAGGLAVEVAGLAALAVTGPPAAGGGPAAGPRLAVGAGRVAALAGAAVVASLLAGLFRER